MTGGEVWSVREARVVVDGTDVDGEVRDDVLAALAAACAVTDADGLTVPEATAVEFGAVSRLRVVTRFAAPVDYALPRHGYADPVLERGVELRFTTEDPAVPVLPLRTLRLTAGEFDVAWEAEDDLLTTPTLALADVWGAMAAGELLVVPGESRPAGLTPARARTLRVKGSGYAERLAEEGGVERVALLRGGPLPNGGAPLLPRVLASAHVQATVQEYVTRTALLAHGLGRELRAVLAAHRPNS